MRDAQKECAGTKGSVVLNVRVNLVEGNPYICLFVYYF